MTRNRQSAWGRSVAGYLARKLGGYPVKVIAEHFGRDPVVMSRGIRSVEEKAWTDKRIAKALASLEETLIQERRRKIVI